LQRAGEEKKRKEAVEQGRWEIDAADEVADHRLEAEDWHDGIKRDQHQGAGGGADEQADGQPFSIIQWPRDDECRIRTDNAPPAVQCGRSRSC
jgi:hypothetical protein